MPWLVGLGDGWTELDAEAAAKLDEAKNNGLSTVQYRSRGQNFEATMTGGNWVQKNLHTGLRRPLKLWNQSGAPGLVPQLNDDAAAPAGGGAEMPKEQKDAGQVALMGPLENLRIYVWRTGDWHPLAPRIEQQIKANLRQGKVVFEVRDRRQKFMVDTTGSNGWVQITSTGQRRRMKTAQTLESAGASVKSALVPSRGDHEGGLLEALRAEWAEIVKAHDGRLSMGELELARSWARQGGVAGKQDRQLLEQSAADFFLKVDLTRNQAIEETEWLHYRLMQEQAPSFHAVSQVNELLIREMKMVPDLLKRLVEQFMQSVQGTEDARLTPSKMREAVEQWIAAGNSGPTVQNVNDYEKLASELHADRNEFDSMPEGRACGPFGGVECLFRQDFGTGLLKSSRAAPSAENGSEEEEEHLTYYDFLNIMLVRRKVSVQLYMYDLSRGKIKWLSPLLLGRALEGVWHTGVVVHDKEYWFGGNIFESEVGRTPFGKPDQIRTIGETMRTRNDLWNFIQRELVDEFTPENYDVLTHNCNHFSTAVCMFLMNQNIPDDVLKQPELFMNSWLAHGLRPVLNRSLGRFGADSDGVEDGGLLRTTDAKKAELEWDHTSKNSLVIFEYEPGWTCIGRVMAKDKETCDVRWLDVGAGSLSVQKGVSRLHVHLLKLAKEGAHDARHGDHGFGMFNSTYHTGMDVQQDSVGAEDHPNWTAAPGQSGPKLKKTGPTDRTQGENDASPKAVVPNWLNNAAILGEDPEQAERERQRVDDLLRAQELELSHEELRQREDQIKIKDFVRQQMSKLDR